MTEHPAEGGSYIVDPVTGARRREGGTAPAPTPAERAASAAAEQPELVTEAETGAAPAPIAAPPEPPRKRKDP